VALGTGIAGVAALGVGVGFSVAENSAWNQGQQLRAGRTSGDCNVASAPGCSAIQQNANSQRSDAIAAFVGYGAGVALLGTAAALWFTRPREGDRQAVVLPIVGPGVVGAHVITSF
jgi:hypothetical protein